VEEQLKNRLEQVWILSALFVPPSLAKKKKKSLIIDV
jgi:hypothetical protein